MRNSALTKQNKLYYVRMGVKGSLTLSPGFAYCKYLLMYTADRQELFQLKGKGPRIMTKLELQQMGFKPNSEIYLVFDLETPEPVVTFQDRHGVVFHIKKQLTPRKRDPYFTTLKELMASGDGE